ncbi:MAG: hypothetical protein ACTSO7_01905 [Candidatus Heimdallarchaeota archaeon]
MVDVANTPTITALVMMSIAIFATLAVVTRMFIQYSKRKRSAALLIGVAFLFWGLAAISTFVGALLQYIYYNESGFIEGAFQYSRYGINIGYALSAISNIFIIYFVSEIYSQSRFFRRTKKTMPIFHSIANGVTVGFIINMIVESLDPSPLNEIYYNPSYPLGMTVYHLFLTVMAFTALLAFSTGARRKATLRWEKAGFTFIMWTAITAMLVYLFFVIDLLVQNIWEATFGSGYTLFNNLGWLTAAIMVNLAYIGFFMPNWIRERLKQSEEN